MKKLIILNGSSSSGKSVLAKYLQKLLPEPFCLLSMDTYMEMGPKKFPFEQVVPPIIKSMIHSIPVFLLNGNNVIADCVLYNPKEQIAEINRFIKALKIEEHIMIFLVKVFASEVVLMNRELLRDDRQPGLAKSQVDIIHNGINYDIEIDTTEISAYENAKSIIEKYNEYISTNG